MAKAGAAKNRKIEIEAVKHKDKRVNIPTEELRDFISEEEKTPKKLLYPRDPSLDPQLAWKGKDEQDTRPLEVPAVPIYIQEKVHPQALIEDLRRSATKSGEPQIELFGDFNGLTFESLIDFYHHEQSWTNRLILGDSLLVMASLAGKEGLKGKVQMVYIDPPYGIKFSSNWQVSTRKREVKDGTSEDVTRQPEQIKAFRDTWELGIHSYLAYLRDRLAVAHELLSESGSVFVQIGDENVHLVRCILDEVFGSANFVSQINFRKTGGATTDFLANVADHILWYAKSRESLKYRQLYRGRANGDAIPSAYALGEDGDGRIVRLTEEELASGKIDTERRPLQSVSLESAGWRSGDLSQPYEWNGHICKPREGAHWKTPHIGITRLGYASRVLLSGNTIRYKMYLDDFPVTPLSNIWVDVMGAAGLVYVVQTTTKVIERCLLMSTDPGDLVLDPTCGSGTTAFVAEQWGRRWITIDTSRVALALTRSRLMSATFPYYLLSDSDNGLRKEAEVTHVPVSESKTEGDIKKGFVYRRVQHIELRTTSSNEEIDHIYARWEEKLEPIRKEINKALKQSWRAWEIPVDSADNWPEKARLLHEELLRFRRERRKEIDNSIAALADKELLFDQPYEDSKRIRVTGPFTVESLSPHRMLSINEERSVSEKSMENGLAAPFETMIIENLRKAGVQNTVKQQRLKFDRLEPYAGVWIQAAGEYTESTKPKRVAISIGPEYGTVGPEMVKEAAKEAVQGVGFDLLIVCGFAFDPHVSEEAKRYGKLNVLIARMNPDLSMGNELLKKTGAGNLFMVFGEPDLSIERKNGNATVTLKGVDVYDPTTGQIRNSSTDDIACWFIDTDYNGESFFVRHAYFTGAGDPYEKLRKALRADIDEAAWLALYSTTSRPFSIPRGHGKSKHRIAVKVINHYGDEVMKVYSL